MSHLVEVPLQASHLFSLQRNATISLSEWRARLLPRELLQAAQRSQRSPVWPLTDLGLSSPDTDRKNRHESFHSLGSSCCLSQRRPQGLVFV